MRNHLGVSTKTVQRLTAVDKSPTRDSNDTDVLACRVDVYPITLVVGDRVSAIIVHRSDGHVDKTTIWLHFLAHHRDSELCCVWVEKS